MAQCLRHYKYKKTFYKNEQYSSSIVRGKQHTPPARMQKGCGMMDEKRCLLACEVHLYIIGDALHESLYGLNGRPGIVGREKQFVRVLNME